MKSTNCKASEELENFINEMIKLAKAKNYAPTIFMRMREEYGTIQSITQLVESGEIQSGFKKLKEIGLLHMTIESAVLKFPEEFSKDAIVCAKFRLDNIDR